MKTLIAILAVSLLSGGCVKTLESQKKRYALLSLGISFLFISDKEADVSFQEDQTIKGQVDTQYGSGSFSSTPKKDVELEDSVRRLPETRLDNPDSRLPDVGAGGDER